MSITITTWNVNSLKVRQPQVLDFLKETENSILCLQELKMQEADIDASAFKEIGYTLDAFGEKITATSTNGVAEVVSFEGTAAGDHVRVCFHPVTVIEGGE